MTGLAAPLAPACERVTIRRVPPVTYVLVAEIPPEGVAAFAEYEAAVLPLLHEYGGRLERRLRSPDGCFETHVVTFPHEAALAAYRGDARRDALAALLRRSAAATQLHQVEDVPEQRCAAPPAGLGSGRARRCARGLGSGVDDA